MTIADKIKAIREAKRITQSEVARAIGVEPTNYPRIEKRGNSLTYELIARISEALEVTVVELITWGDEKQQKGDSRSEQLELRIKELEDRVVDKEKIIQKLEEDSKITLSAIRGIVWEIVEQEAVVLGVGKMRLKYKRREDLIIPTKVFNGSDRSISFSSRYNEAFVDLTKEEAESVFMGLLDEYYFRVCVIRFFHAGFLKDTFMNQLVANYLAKIYMRNLENE